MNTKIKNKTGALLSNVSAKPSSVGKPMKPTLTQYHYSVALRVKPPVFKEISGKLSHEIELVFKSLKVARGNVILVLAPNGLIYKHSMTGFQPKKAPLNSLIFICVSSAAAATGWAHSVGGRWAIKLNCNNQYPKDTIIGLIVGWVTAGNYARLYENLDAAALASLIKYYHETSGNPPHKPHLIKALRAQVTARIVASGSNLSPSAAGSCRSLRSD